MTRLRLDQDASKDLDENGLNSLQIVQFTLAQITGDLTKISFAYCRKVLFTFSLAAFYTQIIGVRSFRKRLLDRLKTDRSAVFVVDLVVVIDVLIASHY